MQKCSACLSSVLPVLCSQPAVYLFSCHQRNARNADEKRRRTSEWMAISRWPYPSCLLTTIAQDQSVWRENQMHSDTACSLATLRVLFKPPAGVLALKASGHVLADLRSWLLQSVGQPRPVDCAQLNPCPSCRCLSGQIQGAPRHSSLAAVCAQGWCAATTCAAGRARRWKLGRLEFGCGRRTGIRAA